MKKNPVRQGWGKWRKIKEEKRKQWDEYERWRRRWAKPVTIWLPCVHVHLFSYGPVCQGKTTPIQPLETTPVSHCVSRYYQDSVWNTPPLFVMAVKVTGRRYTKPRDLRGIGDNPDWKQVRKKRRRENRFGRESESSVDLKTGRKENWKYNSSTPAFSFSVTWNEACFEGNLAWKLLRPERPTSTTRLPVLQKTMLSLEETHEPCKAESTWYRMVENRDEEKNEHFLHELHDSWQSENRINKAFLFLWVC